MDAFAIRRSSEWTCVDGCRRSMLSAMETPTFHQPQLRTTARDRITAIDRAMRLVETAQRQLAEATKELKQRLDEAHR